MPFIRTFVGLIPDPLPEPIDELVDGINERNWHGRSDRPVQEAAGREG